MRVSEITKMESVKEAESQHDEFGDLDEVSWGAPEDTFGKVHWFQTREGSEGQGKVFQR